MNRILIVDDEPQVRLMLSTCLGRAGFDVSEAADGEEALKINAAAPVDLIVLDLLMPGMEGLETLMSLRKDRDRPRVIAISGGSRSGVGDFLPTALKLGADKTLKKPFHNDELIEAIHELL
jgi:DNA-binding response OmpR family regulator